MTTPPTVLVLGGTRFVGRALLDAAVDRGWTVTAVHRRPSPVVPPGVRVMHVDRTQPVELAAALGDDRWDLVVDTWSGAPSVIAASAQLLTGRADRYGYVSSASVYRWPEHVDESSPLVDGDPDATDGDYAALKRGGELAVLGSFPDALLARAGLILGPAEDIGRLPWWLKRIARGGRVVAPGRPDRPLQYVDARDLADWMLTGLASGLGGPVDVISPPGHTTTEKLLTACRSVTGSDATFVWISEERLAEVGAQPWTQLPIWVPENDPEFAQFMNVDTSRAAATGLVCRPVKHTVADTWAWLQAEGLPAQRLDRASHGLPPELEAQLLDHDRQS